jgi:hypothetical protein
MGVCPRGVDLDSDVVHSYGFHQNVLLQVHIWQEDTEYTYPHYMCFLFTFKGPISLTAQTFLIALERTTAVLSEKRPKKDAT